MPYDHNGGGWTGFAAPGGVPDGDTLEAFMLEEAYKPLTFEELVDIFHVSSRDEATLAALLESMQQAGTVVRTRTGRYGAPRRMNLVVGRLQAHARGFAFVIPDDAADEGDVFIGPDNLGGAMHRDRVIARLLRRAGGGPRQYDGGPTRRREGEIIRILERANRRIVGVMDRTRRHGFVTPADPRLGSDVFVGKDELRGARSGEVVVVEITGWPGPRRGPEGEVIQRLGMPGDPGVDGAVIMFKHGRDPDFPPEVMAEADKIPDHVSADDMKGRADLRHLTTVTIDGADAKDLDDALSLEVIEPPAGGRRRSRRGQRGRARRGVRWRLGVHIADVSHYVRPGSAIDLEARRRGTSVYLVDQVIPMLPPILSNGICSLNAGVDRLAVSVLMDLDGEGRLIDHEIVPSVIRVDHRLTYDEVDALLASDKGADGDAAGPGDAAAGTGADAAGTDGGGAGTGGGRAASSPAEPPYAPMVRELSRLARLKFDSRLRRGAIDFDLREPRVILDEEGRVEDLVTVGRTPGTSLIEELMILCNETVARQFFRRKIPFLYRIHEPPESEAAAQFREFAALFGFHLPDDDRLKPVHYQSLLNEVKGRPEEYLINTVALRSMQRARYSAGHQGHFGLASEWYSHFTAPIRRYPDLMIHRIIKEASKGDLSPRRTAELLRDLPGLAAHCSAAEREAEDAERESLDLKKAEYMERYLGEVFDAIVSGVTSFGLFIQLSNTVEGLIHVSTMTDDYYHFDEKAFALYGERTGQRFRLGDPLRAQLIKVNKETRTIDFRLDPEDGPRRKGASAGGRAGGGKNRSDGSTRGGSNSSASPPRGSAGPRTRGNARPGGRRSRRNRGRGRGRRGAGR